MKQGWIQTLGGLAILIFVPVLTILCLSPDVHEWVRNSLTDHSREQNSSHPQESNSPSELIKHYRLPDALSKIATVSEEETNLPASVSSHSSSFSRAIFRLQRALQAYPNWDTKEVFRIANSSEGSGRIPPCPIERIDGEQSVMLSKDKHNMSVTETLNGCAAAIERMTGQEHEH